MQAIARYDDVAKLLITIGGFLLAVLAAGYSTMLKDLRESISVPLTTKISVAIFASMLMFFTCAAAVCFPQPKMLALRILLNEGNEDNEDLKTVMKVWCENIDKVILIKRILLFLATYFFILSFLVMSFFLLNLLGMNPTHQ